KHVEFLSAPILLKLMVNRDRAPDNELAHNVVNVAARIDLSSPNEHQDNNTYDRDKAPDDGPLRMDLPPTNKSNGIELLTANS
ncbi:hypothetical protein, partial [Streptococcus anginosus]|uniref:hypothetical protein n=1 Tax=Streptococcus anginosus TaxID=1328 RepID=UPI002ED84B74